MRNYHEVIRNDVVKGLPAALNVGLEAFAKEWAIFVQGMLVHSAMEDGAGDSKGFFALLEEHGGGVKCKVFIRYAIIFFKWLLLLILRAIILLKRFFFR